MQLASESVGQVINEHMTGLFEDFDEFVVATATGDKKFAMSQCAALKCTEGAAKGDDADATPEDKNKSTKCAICAG